MGETFEEIVWLFLPPIFFVFWVVGMFSTVSSALAKNAMVEKAQSERPEKVNWKLNFLCLVGPIIFAFCLLSWPLIPVLGVIGAGMRLRASSLLVRQAGSRLIIGFVIAAVFIVMLAAISDK